MCAMRRERFDICRRGGLSPFVFRHGQKNYPVTFFYFVNNNLLINVGGAGYAIDIRKFEAGSQMLFGRAEFGRTCDV